MRPDKQKQMMAYLTRPARELIETGQVKFASDLVNPDPRKDVIEIDAINSFMKRNPRAQGGRINFVGGTDPKTGMGFQKGNQFGKELKGKPSLNVTGKNQYTPKTTKEIQAIIDANPDYITPKNFYEPTDTMQKKGMKKLLTLTDTQNPDVVFKRKGYPESDPEKSTATDKKRTTAKKNLEGRIVQLKSPKGYQVHHIMPLAGGEDLRTGDYAVVSKEMNAKMSKYNTKINKLVNEAYDLDYSKTPSLKRLDKINNELFDILKTTKKELPKKYKGLLGFNKLTPVLDTFDDKGKQVFNVEPQGIDYKKSIAGSQGDKVRNTKKSVMQKMVDNAPKFKAAIPGIETLFKTAASIGDDVKKAKYLKAGFKTLGIAAAPLVIYDTYKAFEQGKPILESLEQGLIGTDLIGGTKRILSLTPEEREARSVVKQDALKDLNLDMPMGFGFIEGPTPDSDLTLEQALAKATAGDQRVLDLETQKNLQRSQNRGFGTPVMADQLLSSGGVASGPPPESGPQPQGLQGLLKRGIKI